MKEGKKERRKEGKKERRKKGKKEKRKKGKKGKKEKKEKQKKKQKRKRKKKGEKKGEKKRDKGTKGQREKGKKGKREREEKEEERAAETGPLPQSHAQDLFVFRKPLTPTLSRDNPDPEVRLWIKSNIEIGPVLEVKTICHFDVYGIEILISSTSGNNTNYWVVISRGPNRCVDESRYNDPD